MTPADPMTPEQLWRNTVKFLGEVLPGDTDMKTFNEVARKVYEQMAFLVGGKPMHEGVFSGQIVPERPTTPAGADHRWHFEDGVYKCWDCPAVFALPQNYAGTRP